MATSTNSVSLPYCKVKLRRLRITLQYSKRAAARYKKLIFAKTEDARERQKRKIKMNFNISECNEKDLKQIETELVS
jgi:hypothetical protein